MPIVAVAGPPRTGAMIAAPRHYIHRVLRLVALAGIVAISFSAIFVRLAEVDPSVSALYRAVYALPVLFVAERIWGGPARPAKTRLLAVVGGIVLGIDLNLWHQSIEWIGAGLSTVLANMQVLFVGAIAWALYGERPTTAAIVTIPIGLTGVAFISGLGRDDAFGTDPVAGTIAGVGAGVAYAGFLLFFRHAMKGRNDHPVGPLLDVTIGATLAGLVLLIPSGGVGLAPAWPAHGWLIALALGSQVVGWLIIGTALPRLPGLETALLLLVQPVLTVFWAQLLFDEPLSGLQWAGVVLVLSGILFATTRGTVRQPSEADPPGS